MFKKNVVAFALLFAACFFAGPAHAAWLYQPSEDAFTDEVLHIAVGVTVPYTAGFRCTAEDDLELVYITPELADGETVDTLNGFDPTLLVRVDSAEVVTIPVYIEANDGKFTVVTGNDFAYDMAFAIAKAERRVAFAIEIMGQRMHNKELDVLGSTKALTSLIEACQLQIP